MAVNQTAGTNADDIIIESGKIEVSTDGGSTFDDLGLADNVVITFTNTPRDVQAGNGTEPDRVRGSATQSATLVAEMWQLSMLQLETISGGLFNYSAVAGTPVVGQTDTFAANETEAGEFYAFAVQQFDESTPTAIVLTQDPSGTPAVLVLNTDYKVVKLGGLWGYYYITAVTYDATKAQQAVYNVTPSVSTKVNVGGSSSQASYVYRVTNNIPTESGVTYDIYNYFNIYRGTLSGDIVWALKNKDDTDPAARVPMTIAFELDSTRDAKDQLMSIERVKVTK